MTDQAPATPTPGILQSLQEATNPGQQPQAPATVGFNGPQGNLYDSGKARVPAPQVPMRPAGQPEDTDEAPDVHPVDAMASAFIDHLISKDKGPAAPPQEKQDTGSFGDKLAGALGAVGSGLGDMRTGGDPSKGHGWLGAVGATLNARNERVEREKQQNFEREERLKSDQINLARANMEAVTNARTMQFQDKSVRDTNAASNAKFFDTMRDNYKVQDNISQSALEKLNQDPEFARTHTARITSYEPVLDASGNPKLDPKTGIPVEMPLYSTVNVAPGDVGKQYTVSAETAKTWADAGLKKIPAGTQMPLTVALDMGAQAQKYGSSLAMLNLAKVQPLPTDVKDEMSAALKSTEVASALAANPGNVLGGLFDAQAVTQQHIQAGQEQLAAAQQKGDQAGIAAAQDYLNHAQETAKHLDTTINQGFTEEERKQYVKEAQAQAKQDALDQKNIAAQEERNKNEATRNNIEWFKAQHPNGIGVGGGANGDIPISEGMQQQIDQLRVVNPTGASILDHYDNTSKAALMSVAFGDGSVDFNHAFPSRLTKGAPGLNAQQALAVIKQINPTWDPHQYKANGEAYKFATTGKNAAAIQQYNNFIQHSSEAVDALGMANRQGPRVWNTALNKLEDAGYGVDATRIKAALSGPRGELALLLKGGYSPDPDESRLITSILADDATPAQLSTALQQYAKLGTVRLDNINENYKRVTGKNLPRLVSPKTLDAAKHLGVDDLTYGTLQGMDSTGTIFGPQTPAGANLPPLPKAPQGQVSVQIPGHKVATIPQQQLNQFKAKYPNARIGNE
jgi:hypothetical protein